MVLVLSRSRSVTPAEGAYDRTDYPSYNYLNSGRPPKILESPLDSKSLLSGMIFFGQIDRLINKDKWILKSQYILGIFNIFYFRFKIC